MKEVGDWAAIFLLGVFLLIIVVAMFASATRDWNKPRGHRKPK